MIGNSYKYLLSAGIEGFTTGSIESTQRNRAHVLETNNVVS